jgi:hypothetical protein
MYVIIAINDWEIEQMNVKTTFLYNKILEDVYVVQFTSFELSKDIDDRTHSDIA